MSKESFLILTPAILYLYLWIYSLKNNTGIIKSLKNNFFTVFISSIVSLFILKIIIDLVGVNQNHSYSGVNFKLFSTKTIIDFLETVINTDMFLIFLLGLFIFFENEIHKNKLSSDYIKKHLKNLYALIGLSILIIVPQYILYYKTGFVDRYHLPYLIGYSFLLIYVLKIIFESITISKFTKYLYLITIIVYLSLTIVTKTIPTISTFSKYCNATVEVVNSIKNNENEDLLIVLDPAQAASIVNSLKTYMDYLKINKDYKYEFVKSEKINKFFSDTTFYNKTYKYAVQLFGNKLFNSEKESSKIDMILIFSGLNKPFIEKNKSWFKESDFKKKQTITYTLYYK
ncbi:MAG: hypothetical protein IPM96_08010 [Ignavibacteria bacterium]|nr:hypothetical protein [Ignavibacteria bacterium]